MQDGMRGLARTRAKIAMTRSMERKVEQDEVKPRNG